MLHYVVTESHINGEQTEHIMDDDELAMLRDDLEHSITEAIVLVQDAYEE